MTATGTQLSLPARPRDSARPAGAKVVPLASAAAVPKQGSRPEITVRVWPFGLLATQVADRPLVLRFPADASAGDVLAAMGERYGAAFIQQITPQPGQLVRCCRLFVDGEPVDDLSQTLSAEGRAVDIEIILIMGYEGG